MSLYNLGETSNSVKYELFIRKLVLFIRQYPGLINYWSVLLSITWHQFSQIHITKSHIQKVVSTKKNTRIVCWVDIWSLHVYVFLQMEFPICQYLHHPTKLVGHFQNIISIKKYILPVFDPIGIYNDFSVKVLPKLLSSDKPNLLITSFIQMHITYI